MKVSNANLLGLPLTLLNSSILLHTIIFSYPTLYVPIFVLPAATCQTVDKLLVKYLHRSSLKCRFSYAVYSFNFGWSMFALFFLLFALYDKRNTLIYNKCVQSNRLCRALLVVVVDPERMQTAVTVVTSLYWFVRNGCNYFTVFPEKINLWSLFLV